MKIISKGHMKPFQDVSKLCHSLNHVFPIRSPVFLTTIRLKTPLENEEFTTAHIIHTGRLYTKAK